MSRTEVHAPLEVQHERDGHLVVDPIHAEQHDVPVEYYQLPWHEIVRRISFGEARGVARRKLNRSERLTCRRAIRRGDWDALEPRWAARGRVRWDLT